MFLELFFYLLFSSFFISILLLIFLLFLLFPLFFFSPFSSFFLLFPLFLSSSLPLFLVSSIPLLYNFSSLFYIEGFYLKASRGLKASSICSIDLSFSGLPTMDTTSKRSQSSILFFFT